MRSFLGISEEVLTDKDIELDAGSLGLLVDGKIKAEYLKDKLPFNKVMLYGTNHHLAKNRNWGDMIIMGECKAFISTIDILLRQLAFEGILPWEANVTQIIKTRHPSKFL